MTDNTDQMTDNTDGERVYGVNRRTVLKGSAAGAGIVGMSGLATADEPCFKGFDCKDEGTYIKFELVENDDGSCSFIEETSTGFLEVTIESSKNGDSCEPTKVSWESTPEDPTYVATKGLAFGGNECDEVVDPESGSYESGLVNEGGNTAAISNLQFCVVEVFELPVEDVYIGYEDRPASGDFDYNDFGMDANITETYVSGDLQTIDLEFTSRVYKAGDDHLIHIQRDVPDGVKWDYTLSRSGTTEVVTNDVTPAGSGPGSGDLGLTLFDTGPLSNGDSTDATVTATVEITSGSVSPPADSPRPDEAADNPLFEVYDPYMENTSQGRTIDLGTVQSDVNKSATNWDKPADIPNIVVIPVTNFTPPDEQVTITNKYPDFDDYYAGDPVGDGKINVDTSFDGWFNP